MTPRPPRLVKAILIILKRFFHHLYHSMAWTYDGVAAAVSLGMWKDWVYSILPYASGPTLLELGHGPGHLQTRLLGQGLQTVGLDESHQMGRLALRRLRRKRLPARLLRGISQALPFADQSFQQVLATFPSEYIFHPQTLSEVYRVLCPDGQLVVLPLAWITGQRLTERAAAWLFRVTGQAAPLEKIYFEAFQKAGFLVQTEHVSFASSRVLLVLATKPK